MENRFITVKKRNSYLIYAICKNILGENTLRLTARIKYEELLNQYCFYPTFWINCFRQDALTYAYWQLDKLNKGETKND